MKGGQAQQLAFLSILVTLDLSKSLQRPGKLYYVTIYCVVIWVFTIPLSLPCRCSFAEPMLLASCITWPKIARIISIASGVLWWQYVTYASSCMMTKASSRYRLRCTSLTGNLFTSTTVRIIIECRKPLINVPYIRTFGAPDQGQTLDVRESQTIEAGFPKRQGSLDIKTDHVIILTQDCWSWCRTEHSYVEVQYWT